MDEDEKVEAKAKKMAKLTDSVVESSARSFEEWLRNHQDSTKDEVHEELKNTIGSAVMMCQMMLGFML